MSPHPTSCVSSPPSKCISAPKKARNGQGPKDGLGLIRIMTGFGTSARAAARRALQMGASDESGRALQYFASSSSSMQELVRKAVFRRRLLARKVRRVYIGLGLKMCASLASLLANSCMSVEDWLQFPSTCRTRELSSAPGPIAKGA